MQAQSDEHLQAWVAAKHYADLILQPVTKGPVMVYHAPRFLRHRRSAGKRRSLCWYSTGWPSTSGCRSGSGWSPPQNATRSTRNRVRMAADGDIGVAPGTVFWPEAA